MKSVLISINPKWCELIASGEKTVEVRKTRPKLETPFKVYIYETKGKLRWCNICQNTDCERPYPNCACFEGWGKVIGEFVCDRIINIPYIMPYDIEDTSHPMRIDFIHETCIPDWELDEYLGRKDGYGWHISDLKIYDEPRELWEFKTKCKEYGSDNPNCTECHYYIDGMCYEYDESDCGCNGRKPIIRPPQSWCYVEDTE